MWISPCADDRQPKIVGALAIEMCAKIEGERTPESVKIEPFSVASCAVDSRSQWSCAWTLTLPPLAGQRIIPPAFMAFSSATDTDALYV